MIKIQKGEVPQILSDNELIWTNAVRDKINNGETPSDTENSRYRHADIKEALILETFGKCAYCESKILHISYGDVEHIEPKSRDVENIFKWSNLTLACDRCNTNKGTIEGILDPNVDDPADAFEFLGPVVVPNPGDDKALVTERVLKLNRGDLCERRTDKIRYLSDQLLVLNGAANPSLRAILCRDILENETAASQEFAATARSFIKVMLPKVLRQHGDVTV